MALPGGNEPLLATDASAAMRDPEHGPRNQSVSGFSSEEEEEAREETSPRAASSATGPRTRRPRQTELYASPGYFLLAKYEKQSSNPARVQNKNRHVSSLGWFLLQVTVYLVWGWIAGYQVTYWRMEKHDFEDWSIFWLAVAKGTAEIIVVTSFVAILSKLRVLNDAVKRTASMMDVFGMDGSFTELHSVAGVVFVLASVGHVFAHFARYSLLPGGDHPIFSCPDVWTGLKCESNITAWWTGVVLIMVAVAIFASAAGTVLFIICGVKNRYSQRPRCRRWLRAFHGPMVDVYLVVAFLHVSMSRRIDFIVLLILVVLDRYLGRLKNVRFAIRVSDPETRAKRGLQTTLYAVHLRFRIRYPNFPGSYFRLKFPQSWAKGQKIPLTPTDTSPGRLEFTTMYTETRDEASGALVSCGPDWARPVVDLYEQRRKQGVVGDRYGFMHDPTLKANLYGPFLAGHDMRHFDHIVAIGFGTGRAVGVALLRAVLGGTLMPLSLVVVVSNKQMEEAFAFEMESAKDKFRTKRGRVSEMSVHSAKDLEATMRAELDPVTDRQRICVVYTQQNMDVDDMHAVLDTVKGWSYENELIACHVTGSSPLNILPMASYDCVCEWRRSIYKFYKWYTAGNSADKVSRWASKGASVFCMGEGFLWLIYFLLVRIGIVGFLAIPFVFPFLVADEGSPLIRPVSFAIGGTILFGALVGVFWPFLPSNRQPCGEYCFFNRHKESRGRIHFVLDSQ